MNSSDPVAKTATPTPDPGDSRRCFCKKTLALGVGSVLAAVPLGTGLTVLLAPLRQQPAQGGKMVFLCTLDALPADGSPRRFAVTAIHQDAWNRTSGIVGAVYLRRRDKEVLALNVSCPHAGCFVDFSTEHAGYFCPCHASSFDLDGAIRDQRSPAPRGLDSLEVEVRNENEVWVKFQNFRAGDVAKVPV